MLANPLVPGQSETVARLHTYIAALGAPLALMLLFAGVLLRLRKGAWARRASNVVLVLGLALAALVVVSHLIPR